MLTPFQCVASAVMFLVLFVISLTLDLHGAVAVAVAIPFFLCLSASMVNQQALILKIKRGVGWVLFLGTVANLVLGPKNIVFVATVFVCGAILAFDQLSSWMVRPRDDAK